MNTNVDFEQLRSSFAGKAHAYHLSRPPYKSELISSIFEHCALKEGARVLEIGCGTGQATQGFLDRGAIVTAVEKASDMASYARGCLRASPTQLTIHTQAFEEFELEAGSYSGDRCCRHSLGASGIQIRKAICCAEARRSSRYPLGRNSFLERACQERVRILLERDLRFGL